MLARVGALRSFVCFIKLSLHDEMSRKSLNAKIYFKVCPEQRLGQLGVVATLVSSSQSGSRSGNRLLSQGRFLSPGAQLIRALTLFTKYKSDTEEGSTFLVVKQQEAACVWLHAHQPHELDCLVHTFSF